MSVELVHTAVSRGRKAEGSTSIRVAVSTRDVLAGQAARAGLSLSGYLAKLAERNERESILAQYRACAIEAYQDAQFRAEMAEWDEVDV